MVTGHRHILVLIVMWGCAALAGAPGSARDIVPTAGPIAPADTMTAGFVGLAAQGPLDEAVLVTSWAEFGAVFGTATTGLANPYLAPSVAAFFANGGGQARIVRVASDAPADLIGFGSGPTATGLRALAGWPDVSVVAIPGVGTDLVQDALLDFARRQGLFAVLDPASPTGLPGIQLQRAGLDAPAGHGALYFPWIHAAPTGVSQLLPPSGFVAGLICATSPSDSPFGVLATAIAVAVDIDTATNDQLNAQNINVIRNLAGIRVWGARTLSSDPEWRYVAVRRMALHMARSIGQGTGWFDLLDNDATLWNELRTDTDGFLFGLYRSGYFAGTSPNDAYFVQCGLGTTMTAADIAAGRVILRVGFAPLAPAEFVVVTTTLLYPGAAAVPGAADGRIRLAAPAPNPANPRTTVGFVLDRAANVGVEIVDVAGRRVRTLAPPVRRQAGAHRFAWDGCDDGGRGVASAVYLVRLTGDGAGSQSRPVTLVR
ncbi:hypothetical protein KDM41_12845 [bacterium]|nr:hypothetical protein [bacterium]